MGHHRDDLDKAHSVSFRPYRHKVRRQRAACEATCGPSGGDGDDDCDKSLVEGERDSKVNKNNLSMIYAHRRNSQRNSIDIRQYKSRKNCAHLKTTATRQTLQLGLIVLVVTLVSKISTFSSAEQSLGELKFESNKLPAIKRTNSDLLSENSSIRSKVVASNVHNGLESRKVANQSIGGEENLQTSSNNLQAFLAMAPLATLAQQLNSQPILIGSAQPPAQPIPAGGLILATSGEHQQRALPALTVNQSPSLTLGETRVAPAMLGSSSALQIEPLLTADSKKKKKMKKMKKKEKKMEKKHKEWKKGKKHKKKKYESKKKKGGSMKKKKGKKEKKKWGMEKKGHKKKGNFKKKKWGKKKKMKKGQKKGKKGHKMLKDKGHKKKGFKKVYHKEEYGKKKKWHDIKREKKWNSSQKKWKKKWHQEKGKKYKGKHMKKYHKKNKHGKKYKKEKKSKFKKHKGEKFKKGHKKKKEEYSKKKEGGKKKKMKKMKKEMKKKKKG